MSAAVPLFSEVRFRAMREKRYVVSDVMMANDDIRKVRFGPRGGWKLVGKTSKNLLRTSARGATKGTSKGQ